jgi:hypothetical protein
LVAVWPPGVALAEWQSAAGLALPPLLASLLFAVRLAGLPGLDEPRFGVIGLALIAGCLVAAEVGRARGWASAAGWLATAGALGLTAPALALHLALAERALHDPAPIVVAPALVSAWLLAGAAGLGALPALLRRPPLGLIGPCLLPVGLLLVWPVALAGRADEPLIWGAVALSFALAALGLFGAGLLRGWPSLLPCAIALGLAWLAAFVVPSDAPAARGAADWLPPAHLALAVVGSLAPLLVPMVVAGWQVWRPGRH